MDTIKVEQGQHPSWYNDGNGGVTSEPSDWFFILLLVACWPLFILAIALCLIYDSLKGRRQRKPSTPPPVDPHELRARMYEEAADQIMAEHTRRIHDI